jgi:isocitrate dehydrogenase
MKLCSVTKSFSARTSDFSTIIYTETDEAPMLATYSFLPIAKKILGVAGVDVVKRDISLSGRVLSLFPEKLSADQRIED